MFSSRQLESFQRHSHPLSYITPAFAGCIMVCASFLPWLNDPLGESYSAWKLPIDIGWQFQMSILNYGTLSVGCAFYSFLVAYANWQSPKDGKDCSRDVGFIAVHFAQSTITAGFLCLLPFVLFLIQYLCIDLSAINHLAQHKNQMVLVQQYFGYRVAPQLLALRSFSVDISTVQGRFQLLVDQASGGLLLPCLSAWILIDYKRLLHPAITKKPRLTVYLTVTSLVILAILLGRAPLGLMCEYQGQASLTEGNYDQALTWLDRSLILNPALNQMAYYHIERGEALYLMHPDQQDDDSRIYLAFTYLKQRDYLDAYQQLLALWQSNRTSWVEDEISLTLEHLAESAGPLRDKPDLPMPPKALKKDEAALPWLQLLMQIDSSNAYSRYLSGRIQYELGNYALCITHMGVALQLSPDSDFQSSVYTYIALSHAGEGDYVGERVLLLHAIQLDPNYHNNVAREETSGLR